MILSYIKKLFSITPSLYVAYDNKNKGHTVVFLHGIASTSGTWKPVLPLLPSDYRIVTIDLLGFAKSPKPKSISYNVNDHAKAVRKTIKKLKISKPYTLVGHSMGALISVEIAKQSSKAINHLILVNAPIYNSEDLNKQSKDYKNKKQNMTNILFYIYERLIEKQNLTLKAVKNIIKVKPANLPIELDNSTWYSFKMSLDKTIMQQNTISDIKKLRVPITFIYGSLDPVIVVDNYNKIARENPNVKILKTTAMHNVNKTIAKKIAFALQSHLK